MQRPVEVVGELLGPLGEVGPADAVDEERVAGEDGATADLEHRRSLRVARGGSRPTPKWISTVEPEVLAVGQRLEGELEGVSRIEMERRPSHTGKRPGRRSNGRRASGSRRHG